MENKSLKNQIVKEVKKLLNQQTGTILGAVDERLVNLKIKIDKKLEAIEERWSKKFDKLTTTLDNFLKRITIWKMNLL